MIFINTYRGVAFAAIVSAVAPFYTSGAQYQLNGTAVLTYYYRADNHPVSHSYSDFSVNVTGAQWLITTTNHVKEGVGLSWATGSTNGQEIFYTTYYTNGYTLGIVESNSVPSGCEDGISQYLWLMLSSGCYLDSAKSNSLPPIFDPVFSVLYDKSLTCPALIERLEATPRLPKKIVFLNDGYYRTRDVENRNTIKNPVSSPYENGFTNAVLETSSVTNFDNMEFPSACSFTEYGPSISQDGTSCLAKKRRLEVSLTKVSHLPKGAASLPALPGKTVVQDRRLLDVKSYAKPLTYSVTDGVWKSADYALALSKSYSRQNGKQRVWIVRSVLIALILLLPFALLAMSKNRQVSLPQKNGR